MNKYYQVLQEDDEYIKEVYGSKHDMVTSFHYLLLTYLRGFRCYHLKDFLCDDDSKEDFQNYLQLQKTIVTLSNESSLDSKPLVPLTVLTISEFFQATLTMLVESKHESTTKLVQLKVAFKVMLDHLCRKGNKDENLESGPHS